MKRRVVSPLAPLLLAGAASAQGPFLTLDEGKGVLSFLSREESPQTFCWYNGDLDFRAALSSERNTAVSDSWTFDDFDWPGGMVTGFRAHFLPDRGTPFAACDIIVYSGLSEGTFGTLMAEVSDVRDFTLTPTGNNFVGRDEYRLDAALGGSAFRLAPGTYHVGIRLVGVGSGQAFVLVTSGANAVGTPPGNNGLSYLQSFFFGYPLPVDWQRLKGAGRWDVSFGLVCGEAYLVSVTGECPGTVRVEWSGADPDRQQGILAARATGNFVIPTGACEGTELGLGAQSLRLHGIIGTGGGAGAVNASTRACGWYVQLIQTHSCATSNVAQVP